MNFLVGVYEKSMPESFSLSQKLATVRKAGFDFLELSIDESDAKLARLKWSSSERSQLRREMEDNNIYLRSMCLSGHRRFPLGSIHSFDASRSLDIMQRAVDLACDLGIRVIQLAGYDTYYGISSQKTLDAFLINLEKAVEILPDTDRSR